MPFFGSFKSKLPKELARPEHCIGVDRNRSATSNYLWLKEPNWRPLCPHLLRPALAKAISRKLTTRFSVPFIRIRQKPQLNSGAVERLPMYEGGDGED